MAAQKPKRPSMLTRQRQLRAQQQQVKNASRNQLPSAGGSSGNSRQARAQRANTTRAQAANNQRIINRGMEGFIRRGQANDKADAAARGSGPSGTTRTAGAGGVLGRPKPSALTAPNRPASKPSGQLASRGGALVRSPGGAVTRPNGQPTRPRGGQIEKAGPTIDVKANTGKLSAGRPGGAIATTTSRATAAAESAAGGAARGLVRGAGRALARGANAAFVIPALVDATREVVQGTQGNQEWARRSAALRNQSSGVRTGTASGRTGRGGTTADRMGTRTSADTGRYTPGNQQTDWRGSKPPTRRPASTQSVSASTPSRGSSSGGGGSSAPRSMPRAVTRASSGPAPDAGMKNQDKNFRGNLFEKTFGYKPGQAPDQTKGSSKQLDTKSDIYTPSTKVDGSQYADKKPDMKKVDEYNRRRRRYYD